MKEFVLQAVKKIGVKALIYVLDLSKAKVMEVKQYLERVETFHKKIQQEIAESGTVSEETKNRIKKYECENVLRMIEAIKNGDSVSNIKRDMVIKYADLEMNIRGKVIGLITELLLFIM
jgi:hypothetical protein